MSNEDYLFSRNKLNKKIDKIIFQFKIAQIIEKIIGVFKMNKVIKAIKNFIKRLWEDIKQIKKFLDQISDIDNWRY